jgi:hypothetical protein
MYERDKPRSALEIGFPKSVIPFNQDADLFVADILEPIADAIALLANPSSVQTQFGLEAAKAVRSLDRIDNKDWMPPALLRLWKRSSGENTAVGRFLVQLERLAYYLFVTRSDVNERIARFAAIMDEFEPRSDKSPPLDGLTLSIPEQKEFLLALSGPLYQKGRVCKPVLQRLDEALTSGGATYDQLVSIEHVLPQTVEDGSEWAALFPYEPQRAEWTHRLANLVFLTRRINTRASNWNFKRKKEEYFGSRDGASPFVLTQGVLQTDSWTIDHLKHRQEKLIATLSGVWQLNTAATTDKAAVA